MVKSGSKEVYHNRFQQGTVHENVKSSKTGGESQQQQKIMKIKPEGGNFQ